MSETSSIRKYSRFLFVLVLGLLIMAGYYAGFVTDYAAIPGIDRIIYNLRVNHPAVSTTMATTTTTREPWVKNKTLERIVNDFLLADPRFTVKPNDVNLLKSYKNPCFKRINSGRVDCLPAFYIAGFHKCSTSDLWLRLMRHPQVINSNKEVEWWTRLGNKNFDSYISLFAKNRDVPDKIMGDGTPSIMYANRCRKYRPSKKYVLEKRVQDSVSRCETVLPHLIYQYTPGAKFVVLMREPGDRFLSHHFQGYREKYKRRKNKPPPSQTQFDRSVKTEIRLHQQCMSMTGNNTRICVYARPKKQGDVMLEGFYHIFIEDALKIVPIENFLFIRSEDYNQNRRVHLLKVLEFLSLDTSVIDNLLEEIHIDNELEGGKKNWSERISDAQKYPMLPETRKLLDDFFKPINQMLAELLGDDKWLFQDLKS